MIQTHASLLMHRAILAGMSRLFAISTLTGIAAYIIQYFVDALVAMARRPGLGMSGYDFEYWLTVALYAVTHFGVAAFFWFKADVIAAFILRFRPSTTCAGCGYPLGDAPRADHRCPECGLRLDDPSPPASGD